MVYAQKSLTQEKKREVKLYIEMEKKMKRNRKLKGKDAIARIPRTFIEK